MGGRAGEGLAADPPGQRRAVVGAVRLGGGLPGRAAVDGVGAAEAGASRSALDNDFLSPRRETPDVWCWPTSRAPTAEQAERLGRLVREGMGLMIFTGAKLDAGLYNDLLYRQGTRLLPCALKSLVDENIRGLIVEPLRPSPLEKLLELKPSALERVAARQIMAVEEPTDKRDQARVLAAGTTRAGRRRSSNGSSATAASCSGRPPPTAPATTGRSSPASSWRCARPCAARRGRPRWPIRSRPASGCGGSSVQTSRSRTSGSIRPAAASRGRCRRHRWPRTRATAPRPSRSRSPTPGSRGCTAISWDEGPLGNQQDTYAANPDPRESDLERIAAADVKSLFGPLDVEIASARSGGAALFSPTGREISRDLACALFVLLIGESIFATWAGRSR